MEAPSSNWRRLELRFSSIEIQSILREKKKSYFQRLIGKEKRKSIKHKWKKILLAPNSFSNQFINKRIKFISIAIPFSVTSQFRMKLSYRLWLSSFLKVTGSSYFDPFHYLTCSLLLYLLILKILYEEEKSMMFNIYYLLVFIMGDFVIFSCFTDFISR